MKIAIVTDAWHPQVNGVVTTLERTAHCLSELGHDARIVSPEQFRTLPCPIYPEIRLALAPGARLGRMLTDHTFDSIHIATEGPLGIAARRVCLRGGLAFTTSYHTQFPQYVRARMPLPEAWTYAFLRWHHAPARRTLVPTPQQRAVLVRRGFGRVVLWSRGVDTEIFRPRGRAHPGLRRPILIYVGRVAIEKNLEAFLAADVPGTKVVVGDGPDRDALARRYPDAHFVGYKFDADLAGHLSSADALVFPSRTDTFGLVMLEAMACGTPVAAYPVTGPIDVVRPGVDGVLDDDLAAAIRGALELDRDACRASAAHRTWRRATEQFFDHLVDCRTGADLAATVSEVPRVAAAVGE